MTTQNREPSRNSHAIIIQDRRAARDCGMLHHWKADFITDLTGEAIASHIEHGIKTPPISSSVHLHPINGAAQRVDASYERLAAVKTIYDPDNVFHVNQNIPPANGS